MKISYHWLKQFIKIDKPAEDIAALLTDLGLEVEGIDHFESIRGGLKNVVVGHVLACKPHPNADRLQITSVDIGEEQPVQIVCGAPNVAAGQKVPVAKVGAVLYNQKQEALEIKKSKIRGEYSYGMICAEDELGLGSSHEGIMVLADELVPGTPAAQVFEVSQDEIFEIGLTPNRADAMSHWGVARDLRAGLQQQDENYELITPSVSSFHVDSRSLRIPVHISDSELVPRYCSVTLSEVQVGPSPKWLQNRLKAIGIQPRNNVVDATNYVMHELGQPLHAFDAQKISGNQIQVKRLPKNTSFTTLDGVARQLHEEDLMICDAEKPLALAGILGGQNSGITHQTTSIFLESAYFNPINIRRTAKRHGLSTDASFRYERGIDPSIAEYALKRAVLLIQESGGGHVTSDLDDQYPKKIESFPVFLSFEKINKLVGQNLAQETIKSILVSLEIKVNNVTETGMGLTIPAYRVDVKSEADVIEEILRVYGYNNIRFGEKVSASMAPSTRTEDYKLQNVAASQLLGQGFIEIMANSLTTPEYHGLSSEVSQERAVSMLNPLSKELSVLRQSLLFSGLEAVRHNLNRRSSDLRFFEFGKVYSQKDSERSERKQLSLILTGNRIAETWHQEAAPVDFFMLKGLVEALLERLGVQHYRSAPVGLDVFSEGLSLYFEDQEIVCMGLLEQRLQRHFDIEQEVFYAQFNWEKIAELARNHKTRLQEISKFQSVRRDFALLLDKKISYQQVYQMALATERKLLKSVNLFDVYQGDKLPEGKKSYAVSFTFQDPNRTLTDQQIDRVMQRLQSKFEKELGASLR